MAAIWTEEDVATVLSYLADTKESIWREETLEAVSRFLTANNPCLVIAATRCLLNSGEQGLEMVREAEQRAS